MSGTVWSKFFWSDWMSDPSLRMCSVPARGLWMDMLCIAAAHQPIGYVAVGGQPLEVSRLARMAGADPADVALWLAELDEHGVYSVDRKRRIYCRRMIKDAKAAVIARKNGQKGGNPRLRKDTENPHRDKPAAMGGDKPHKPRAKSQEPVVKDADASVPWDGDFAMAWSIYPKSGRERSASRARCWSAWKDAARLVGGHAAVLGVGGAELLGAVKRYVAEDKTHKGDCGAPAFERWLKSGRWDHFLAAGGSSETRAAYPPFAQFEIRNEALALKGEDWVRAWLDPCGWDYGTFAIKAQTGFAADTLRKELGGLIGKYGAKVVGPNA